MSLKTFFAKKNIHKRSKRQAVYHNFSTARSVGILFHISDTYNSNAWKKLAQKLKEKNISVHIACYVKDKNMAIPELDTFFFHSKDISRLAQIKNPDLKQFIRSDFDILLYFNSKNTFELNYIFGLSQSRFKISGPVDNLDADFILQDPKNKESDTFIEQLEKYLELIKPNKK